MCTYVCVEDWINEWITGRIYEWMNEWKKNLQEQKVQRQQKKCQTNNCSAVKTNTCKTVKNLTAKKINKGHAVLQKYIKKNTYTNRKIKEPIEK